MGDYTRVIQDVGEFLNNYHRYHEDVLLSGPAAVKVCLEAGAHGLYVGRVEGGFFLDPGFQCRMDSLWTSIRRAESGEEAAGWSQSAGAFVSDQMTRSPDPNLPPADAFILVMSLMPA